MRHESLGLGEPPREGLRDRVLVLRSHDIFEGLDDEGLILLAEHARSVTYQEGDEIAREGAPTQAIRLVLEGEMALSQGGVPIRVLHTGNAFGALPLLAREPSVRVVAKTRVRILEVPAAAFETALDENYSLLRHTLRVTGAGVLAARGNLPAKPEGELDEGVYYEVKRSLAEQLIRLRSSPFGYMNLDALIDLARSMIETRFEAGSLIWSTGDPSSYALHIDCGRVRCTGPEGGEVDVARGYTLGVLDLWGIQKRAYTARAVTPVIAYQIDFESFLSLLESHVEVGIDLLRGFARALLSARKAAVKSS